MSISVNGQSQVPPGFRFHPTEEELLQYYLKKKVALEKIDLDVIQDVDLNKLEPWDIQDKCRIGSTPQNDWYFFSHKDKKYPTGTRTNRATCSGFWKATGRDKVIYGSSRRIGMRKTLVFYKGRAPHGQKSDWIMHEYRLDDATPTTPIITNHAMCNGNGGSTEAGQEEGWVVCRVFKKKTLAIAHKSSDAPPITTTWSSTTINEGTLEQMLHSMGSTPSTRDLDLDLDLDPDPDPDLDSDDRRFSKLPGLYSNSSSCRNCYQPQMFGEEIPADHNIPPAAAFLSHSEIQDWAALDRLVASHLNGDAANSKYLPTTTLSHDIDSRLMTTTFDGQPQHLQRSSSRRYGIITAAHDYQNESDLWSFAPTSNDQMSAPHPI